MCKAVLVGACSLYFCVVVYNNLTDYAANFAFVQHVLSMDTVFEQNRASWRALPAPWLHHAFYWFIIGWELAAAVWIGMGALKLWQTRVGDPEAVRQARTTAIQGLTVGLLLWSVAFLTIGGEWFLMWQSPHWNGQQAAGRMFTVMGIILLFVHAPDDRT